VLKLRGDIVAGDYVKFRSYFRAQKRIVGLELDSAGGSRRSHRGSVHAVGNDYGGEDTGWGTIRFARLSAKLGIPSSTIGKMVTTPPRKITFLDPETKTPGAATMAATSVRERDGARCTRQEFAQDQPPGRQSLD
jgi:hypothetical protein